MATLLIQSSGKPVRQESSPVSGQQKNGAGDSSLNLGLNSRNLYPASQEQLSSYVKVVHSAHLPDPLQSLPLRYEHGAQSNEEK